MPDTLDTLQFLLDYYGGREQLRDAMKARFAAAPDYMTVHRWLHRRTEIADSWAALLRIMEEEIR